MPLICPDDLFARCGTDMALAGGAVDKLGDGYERVSRFSP
jgi:hypothetical protein